jgi:predicted esterase
MLRRFWFTSVLACLAASCAAAPPRPEPTMAPVPEPSEPSPVAANEPTAVVEPSVTQPGTAAPAPELAKEPERPPPGNLRMPVKGQDDAIVSFPSRAPLPLPVMIVTHGAGNTPDSMCEVFRAIVGDRIVLVCPAGPRIRAGEEGRYYPDHHALEKIVIGAHTEVGHAFPRQVIEVPAVYAGYSQGATMGALMIPENATEYPLLLLVEGGVEGWTLARAKKYRDSGGRRVLFACGTPHCQKHAEKVADTMRKAGLEAKVVTAPGEGHTCGGKVAEAVAASFDWLVQDDARFSKTGGRGPN